MTHEYRVATLNINGITSATRLKMLEEFLHKHDIEIALLQEITHPDLSTLRNYNAHINQGTEGRGAAILTKAEITVTNTKSLPLGRRIHSLSSSLFPLGLRVSQLLIGGPKQSGQ
jgi:exonuclease III